MRNAQSVLWIRFHLTKPEYFTFWGYLEDLSNVIYMAEIQEVYGQKYQSDAQVQRMRYSINVLANNLSQLNLTTRFESHSMWNSQNIKPEAIQELIQAVAQRDSKMLLQHIPKTTSQANMFPYLIDGAVEYFRLIDLKRSRVYLLYLTPFQMEPY